METISKSNIVRDRRSLHRPQFISLQKWIIAGLIILFVLNSFLADLWPVKNIYFYFYSKVDNLLVMDLSVNLAMRYAAGNGIHSGESLFYVLVVKLFYLLVPFRFYCLRLVTVVSTAAGLFFLYRIAVSIFSRRIAILFLFLLVTSPIYVESMRSIGFIPLTNLVVIVTLYFFIRGLEKSSPLVPLALAALFGLLTLSLYLPGKLILIVPVVFCLFFPRRYWKRLLLYVSLVILPVVIADRAIGDVVFDLEYAVKADGEFLMHDPPLSRLLDRLETNVGKAAGYLFQIDRRHFREPHRDGTADCRSRIFNPVYTPFFFLGLYICFRKRRKLGILPLIWFGIFFAGPLLSTELSPRRFILALSPLYLIIAAGLWGAYRFLDLRIRFPAGKRLLVTFSLVFLAVTGGYDLYEFFFRVSRPLYRYSREQLRQIADLIAEEGRGAEYVVFDETRSADLIWGNPYFDRPRIDREVTGKLLFRNPLQDSLTAVPESGKGILYLFSFPSSPAARTAEDIMNLEYLRQISLETGPGWRVINVPGTDFYAVKVTGGEEVVIPAADETLPDFVLPGKVVIPLRISSEYSTVAGATRLMDNRPETFWRVSHTELGNPAWIIRDFGGEGGKSIKFLGALPRKGHPEEFFRTAAIFGSRDGKSWRIISRIEQPSPPESDRWREWSFENEEIYRFYKLEIYDGHSGRGGHFVSLAGINFQE